MNVVKLRRKVETIAEMINEIHRQFADAISAGHKANNARICAGQLLIKLRERFENGEMAPATDWWKWYEEKFVRSRKDAEKVMRLARQDDPEAAHEQEKSKRAEGMRRSRAAHAGRGAHVGSNNNEENQEDEVDHLLRRVEELDARKLQRFLAEIRRRYGHV